MMRKFYLTTIAIFIAFDLSAKTEWNLQGNTYVVDTLKHITVGPGTTYTSLKVDGNYKLRVFYTVTDMTHPNVEMRVVKANDTYTGVAQTSKMAQSHSSEGALHFVAINADFFGNSQPIGTTVANDRIVYATNNGWTHFAMDTAGKPYASNMTFSGVISGKNGSCAVSSVNGDRSENAMVIYNKQKGNSTGTNSYGAEVVVEPISGTLCFGRPLSVKVVSEPTTAGNTPLSTDKYVLSGHGTSKSFIENLSAGDELTINLTLSHNGISLNANQVAGGQPMILSGGQVLDTQNALDHLTALNPRTAVGYDSSGTKIVMLVVDGRSTISQGCVSRVLADIMREVGCSEAMNFDGGGSTTMYIQPLGGVVNKYSDSSERAVTDALCAVATSPTDNAIAKIRFVDWAVTLPKYGYYKPVIYGYNKYDVLINTNVTGFTLQTSSTLGEITGDGDTLFANGSGSAGLTAEYNGLKTTIPVTVGSSEPQFRANRILIDSHREYDVEVYATILDNDMTIDNKALSWSSENDAIAKVSSTGTVNGVSEGSTTIYGDVEDFHGKVDVKVEIPQNHYADFDNPIDITTWKVAKSGAKDEKIIVIGDKGISIDYTISSTRSPYVRISKDIDLYSLPDSIKLVINPNDAIISKLTLQAQPFNERTTLYTTTPTFVANTDNAILIPISEIVDYNDLSKYPITFKYLTFYLSDASATTHHIDIKSMQAVYNHVDKDFIEKVSANSNQKGRVNVYNAMGVLLKSNITEKDALIGLSPGFYIVGNKKIILN